MKHLIPEFDALRARFPAGFESSLVLPCLRRVQEERGYVADSDIDGLVEYLGVPRIQIEEVLSFYGQFRRKPIGRWHIQTCRNVSCSLLRRGTDRRPPDGEARHRAGTDHGGRPLHALDGRVPGVVRQRAGRDDQRDVPRGRQPRKAGRAAGRIGLTCPNTKLLMTFPVTATSHTLAEYRARGGYATLAKVLTQMSSEEVTKEVTASGIQGRGGAAFPMGRKWGVVNLDDGQPHYLCANADEGEPGTFKDRWILENAPHLLLESMLIASYALQVRNAFVYIRGEFDQPYRRLAAALEEAYEAGYFGERILGTDFSCDAVIYRGAGSYVCGEASALLSSIEGKRGYPRNRPPRLTVRGLYQRPTVVNNVETLSNIAGIVAHGAAAFRKVGTAKNPGHAPDLHLGAHQPAGRVRDRNRRSLGQIHLRGLRRNPGRARAEGRDPRRHFHQGAHRRRDRDAQSRQPGGRGRRIVAGLGRHGRHRRRHLHGAAAAGDAALLPPRIVRPMHAVPRRHGLAASDHRSHRGGRGPAGGHRPPVPGLAAERRQHDLRHGRRRRLRRRSAS